jgi:hypothetical protein
MFYCITHRASVHVKVMIFELACVPGPHYGGGPDLQRAGFSVPAKILPAANQAPIKLRCQAGYL